jgi:hypothetical protein
MHAMAPNVAGVIGSAVAAGVLWAVLAPSVEAINPSDVAPVTTLIDSTSTEPQDMKHAEPADKAPLVRLN